MLAALLAVSTAPGAMAQDPEPDASATDAEPVPPLKWLRYSSERFRTLMRMLAARAARSEAKRAAQAKAAEEAKRTVETKAAEKAQRAAEAKRVTDAKAAEDARRTAEAKAAEEAQRAAEAKRAADAKAAEEAKLASEIKTAVPGSRAACANAGSKVAGAGWYVVQRGDSLWSIARAHYGYGRTYRRIYAANRRRIANPRRIYPCQRIYIPRTGRSEAPLQVLRVALEPFIRRRAIDTALPGFID